MPIVLVDRGGDSCDSDLVAEESSQPDRTTVESSACQDVAGDGAEAANDAALATLIRSRRAGLLLGFAANWPLDSLTSLERLASREGDLPGDILDTRDGVIVARPGVGYGGRAGNLAEVVRAILNGTPDSGYFTTPISTLPPSLARELRAPAPYREARRQHGKLWLAQRGTVAPLHVDASDNVHVQLVGRKRFRVYRARDSWRMAPHSPLSDTPNFSRIDPLAADAARFPFFARAVAYEFELAPGDAVYLPMGAWHHVRTLAPSVSVNYWWSSGARAAAGYLADAWKRLRGLAR